MDRAPGQLARLCAAFTGSAVGFALDTPSQANLASAVGPSLAALVQPAVAAALTAQFQALGLQPVGLALELTPGVPSEKLLTAEALPGVGWVDAETLALSLRYAPEPVPPFQPVPFLPPGGSAFGLRFSNEGFQRTVRNPAVRKLARACSRRASSMASSAKPTPPGAVPATLPIRIAPRGRNGSTHT